MMGIFTECIVEDAALVSPNALGYSVLHGPETATGEPATGQISLTYR